MAGIFEDGTDGTGGGGRDGGGRAGSRLSSSNRCTGCGRKYISSIVDESGPDAFKDEGMHMSAELILASLERDEGQTFADREVEKLEARHPCRADISGRLWKEECGGEGGNVKSSGR